MEKTEKPTAQKLKKAREKGQVSKSIELTACALIVGLLFIIATNGLDSIKVLMMQMSRALTSIAFVGKQTDYVVGLSQHLVVTAVMTIAPIILFLTLVSFCCQLAQTGVVFSLEPLKFDIKRLNPVTGFKKLVSISLVFNSLKALFKLAVCAVISFIFYYTYLDKIIIVQFQTPSALLTLSIALLIKITCYLLPAFIFVSVADYLFVRYRYKKELNMSKHEVKQEHKDREGCPKIKGKRRSLQRELLKKSQAMSEIKNADVLITNPSHVAVAVCFDPSMIAPKLLVKVIGKQVVEAKKIARQFNVSIIENIYLARRIYKTTQDGQFLSSEFFPVLAEILKPILMSKGKL